MVQCIPQDSPDAVWPFCPSPVPSVIFAVLFGILTTWHTYQAISYRKPYCWVMVVAVLWQTVTYILREVSIFMPKSTWLYSAWFVMILIGPLWINAFVYMILARMVWCFSPDKKLGGIRAWKLGTLFVCLDILAFFVQVTGASMASGDELTHDEIMRGLHIYMIGVGVQEAFILAFISMLIRFQIIYKRANPAATSPLVIRLFYVLYAVLALITVRIVFRLVEYSAGFETGIPTQEAYAFVFETLPMFVAVLLLNIVHPGQVMPGEENSIPSRKVRKQMIKEGLLPGRRSKKSQDVESSRAELGMMENVHLSPAK